MQLFQSASTSFPTNFNNKNNPKNIIAIEINGLTPYGGKPQRANIIEKCYFRVFEVCMENIFEEKYSREIIGTNSTFDRVIISGSIKPISYKEGLSTYLSAHHILLKDFTSYGNKLSVQLKEQAQLIAQREKVEYIYLNSSKTRKEELIRKQIEKRG